MVEFDPDAIQVFVGGGNEHWLPTTILEYSIRKSSDRLIQVTPLASVERDIPIQTPKDPAQRAATSFSFQRFLIPQALGYKGRGIYLDSDMLLRADIGGLWDTPFPEGSFINMCPGWQSAVMHIDSRCGWAITGLVQLIDDRVHRYKDVVNVKCLGLCANTLDPLWNVMDRPDPTKMDIKRAKLLHFTDMGLQPWLTLKHPHGKVWEQELKDAIADGFLRDEDVMREIESGHVRPSLALVVNEEPPYEDAQFIYPDDRRKLVPA